MTDDTVKCSVCAALVRKEDWPIHAEWHANQSRRPRCKQHTAYQPSCPICVASRA